MIICAVGEAQASIALEDAIDRGVEYNGEGPGTMPVGLGGRLTVSIWSIVDAVRVAKVNNLAIRDQYHLGSNIKFEPYVAPVPLGDGTSDFGGD